MDRSIATGAIDTSRRAVGAAERDETDQATIDMLSKEILELRATVAHLRASGVHVRPRLQSVVARVLVDEEPPSP